MNSFDTLPVIELPEAYATEMPAFLVRMAALHGPIFRQHTDADFQSLFGQWQVYMIGPEANKFVLQSHREHFSHSSGYTPLLSLGGFSGQGLLNIDPPEHTRLRQAIQPAFTHASMEEYTPVMVRTIARHTREWTNQGRVDVYHEARKMTLALIAETLMGFDGGDRLHTLLADLVRIDKDSVEETYDQYLERSQRIRTEVDEELARVIAERRRAPGNDILSILIQCQGNGGPIFNDRQLRDQLYFLLVAGLDTTSLLSAWLLSSLAAHQAYLDEVLGELDRVLDAANDSITFETLHALTKLELAIKETARLYSPVGNVPRLSVKDFTFGGAKVPAGTWIWLSLAGCHRLPHLFRAPELFDPERFAPPRIEDKRSPYAFVPFAGGPRVCIGTTFAWMEVKIMVAHILRHYTVKPIQGLSTTYAYYKVIASMPDGLSLYVEPRRVS